MNPPAHPPTKHRHALVTGGSRGIGEAVVRSLCRRGMQVTVLALDDDDLHRVAAETGATVRGVDLRNRAEVENALMDQTFDVVVNNAGVLPQLEYFAQNTFETIDLLVDINLRAALHVTKLTLPGMLQRNHGHYFFLGSIAGKHPTPKSAAYCATKAALHAFAEGLRCDLLGSAIRVTVLMPGRVETSLYDNIFGGHQAAASQLYEGVEAVQPEDIARVIESALDLPPNVDLTAIEVLPTKQIFGGSTMARSAVISETSSEARADQ
jgi:NADP-dependent 3-hydroxy acid dehydrogenase YdfG